MELIKKYQVNNCDAFHLFLNINLKDGNTICSSIPTDYLNRVASKLLEQIKYAYVPFRSDGAGLLDKLAAHVIVQSGSADFFYPKFLLNRGEIQAEIAAKILNLYDVFFAFPNTHYSAASSPVEFFVMSCFFYSQKHQICKNAKQISVAEFEDHLITTAMKIDFVNLKSNSCKAYDLLEHDASEFLILCDSDDKVLMVISH